MFEGITREATKAISREREALDTMRGVGVTREGLGLSKEPPVIGILEDLIEAAKNLDLGAVKHYIKEVDIVPVREELLEVLESLEAS